MMSLVYNYYIMEDKQSHCVYTLEFCTKPTETRETLLAKTFKVAANAIEILQKEYESAKESMDEYVKETAQKITDLRLPAREHLQCIKNLCSFEKTFGKRLTDTFKINEIKTLSDFFKSEMLEPKSYIDETDSWISSTHLGNCRSNEVILLKIFKRNTATCLLTLEIDTPTLAISSPASAKTLLPSFEKYCSDLNSSEEYS